MAVFVLPPPQHILYLKSLAFEVKGDNISSLKTKCRPWILHSALTLCYTKNTELRKQEGPICCITFLVKTKTQSSFNTYWATYCTHPHTTHYLKGRLQLTMFKWLTAQDSCRSKLHYQGTNTTLQLMRFQLT